MTGKAVPWRYSADCECDTAPVRRQSPLLLEVSRLNKALAAEQEAHQKVRREAAASAQETEEARLAAEEADSRAAQHRKSSGRVA